MEVYLVKHWFKREPTNKIENSCYAGEFYLCAWINGIRGRIEFTLSKEGKLLKIVPRDKMGEKHVKELEKFIFGKKFQRWFFKKRAAAQLV